jgi:hypothetical protein
LRWLITMQFSAMKHVTTAAALCLIAAATPGRTATPLHDSVALNIGVNCQWSARCMAEQRRAMFRALAYVRTRHAARPLIHLCNRNAARARSRVDWVGFDHCIHNTRLRGRSARSVAGR